MTLDALELRSNYMADPVSADSDFITILKLLTIVAEMQTRINELELQQLNMVEAMKVMWDIAEGVND
jgi:hypothetical protein